MRDATKSTVEKLLRKKDVAEVLACSVRSVDRLVSSRRLERVKVLGAVRFRLSQVQAIIEGGAA
jgi:predicted DNA-binding transcriptional regulator AlpA